MVRKSAAEIRPASAKDLERLRAAMSAPIDTSEIPESRPGAVRLKRDTSGKLPRRSRIREAILAEVARRKMTPYRLWKEARVFCPTLSQSAVYEFLKEQRSLELPFAEALLAALQLDVVRVDNPKPETAGVRATPRPRRKA
jgi:hypothetical protein